MKAQKRQKTVTRLALARRLQAIALALAADRPIRIGKKSVRVPDRVTFEQEIDISRDEAELEFEITWSTRGAGQPAPLRKKRSRAR